MPLKQKSNIPWFDLFSVAAFAILLPLQASFLFRYSLGIAKTGFLLLVAFGLSYLAVDFLSAILHWLADRYGNIRSPFFGAQIILPFRAHHLFPKDMTKLPFLVTNGNSCFFVSLIFSIFLLFFTPKPESAGNFFTTAFVTFSCIFLSVTNQLHKWAHADQIPKGVRWLQNRRLILSMQHHALHHRPPYEMYYCVLAGHWDWFLAKIDFYRRAEKGLFLIFGLKAGEQDLRELEKEYQSLIDQYFNH